MSDYLSNARDFKITGGNWSHVGGDQYNYYTTTGEVQSGLLIRGTDEEEAEFGQYHEVKRADVELHRSICSYKPKELQTVYRLGEYECEKKFFAGEIARGNAQGSGLTIVGYEGPEAQEAWLEDFKKCTGFLSVDSIRLLAISRSRIPLLVFARDLVPAAQFMVNVGYLGRVYFDSMLYQWGCAPDDIWMDPQRGTLCRGPRGPYVEMCCANFHVDNVPSSVDLLQEDVWCRFLIGLKSKEVDDFFRGEVFSQRYHQPTDLHFNHLTVVSSLTNTPIAASGISWRDSSNGAVGVVLGNGQTRFTFNNPPTNIKLWPSVSSDSWLPQAWSVFHALGISLNDDLSQFELIVPRIHLVLSLSRSTSKTRRRRYWQRPIFLFIRPLPSTPLQSCTTSFLHYWSSDEDGQLPLSADMCNHLGLPVTLDLVVWRYAYSWSNDIYKTMRQYQIARGFDPNTTDFAQSLGHPAYYKPIQNADSDRFEEIEGKNSIYFRLPSPPVPYRSQMPGESDDDTDLGYNDTDTESDLPDTESDLSYSESDHSDSDSFDSDFESDAHSLSILNPDDDIDTHGHGLGDDFRDINKHSPDSDTSSFEDHDSSPPDMDDLCIRLADLTLV